MTSAAVRREIGPVRRGVPQVEGVPFDGLRYRSFRRLRANWYTPMLEITASVERAGSLVPGLRSDGCSALLAPPRSLAVWASAAWRTPPPQRALSSLSLRAYGADPLDSAIKVFVGLGTQRNLAAFWWRVVGRPEAVQ
jgi:hypothetical protein